MTGRISTRRRRRRLPHARRSARPHPAIILLAATANLLSPATPPPASVQATLVAAAVLPHGDFALDPTLLPPSTPSRRAAEEVAAAARTAGSWLGSAVDPDVVIVSTPHGMELSRDFAVYLASGGRGHADIGGDLRKNGTKIRRVELPRVVLAPDLSSDLLASFSAKEEEEREGGRYNVTGLLGFADSEDAALRWGEAVPLLFVPRRNSTSDGPQAWRRHVIWSHPLRRYDHSPSMVPELLRVGDHLGRWAETRPERIALLISADLSHTHVRDGPYGHSDAAVPFDAAVGRWAAHFGTKGGEKALLETARKLQDEGAMSCGFTGLVMLHGALMGCGSGHSSSLSPSPRLDRSTVLANRNATYYGMMVATFSSSLAVRSPGR